MPPLLRENKINKMPDLEKMLLEITALDKALSKAQTDEQRLQLLAAAFLEHKRESVHWQLSLYNYQQENKNLLEDLVVKIEPINKAFTGGRIVRAFAVGSAKALLLISAVLGAGAVIMTYLRDVLKP
jgi:hypothetical protein